MWLEKLQKFQKENKQIIDLKFDLHLAIYIQVLLNDTINFQLENDSLKIHDPRQKKELSKDEFYYWWQITKFNEIFQEEQDIFRKFNEKKNKINKVISKIKNPEINESDSEKDINKKNNKIQENKEKIMKLNIHMKDEADISNKNINSLKNFREIYPTIESLERFLNNIIIILNSEKDS
tara:strand:+ start:1076 stop:1612 length:537 start_codon:yes stop_codon:yes gene_type:complete